VEAGAELRFIGSSTFAVSPPPKLKLLVHDATRQLQTLGSLACSFSDRRFGGLWVGALPVVG